jgi:hypothetical protein
MKLTGDKKLATEVIKAAVDDLIAINFDPKHDDFQECFDFLTGETEISKFWFLCADLKPLDAANVVSAIKAQYGIKDDPEPTPGWDETFQVYTM